MRQKALDKDQRSDVQRCSDIVVMASVFMDANDADALVALFTEDLEFVRPSTWPEVAIRGRDELHAAITTRDATMVSRHVATNIVPREISADRIVIQSYFTHFRGWRTDGSQAAIPISNTLRSMGEYVDEFALVDGQWLIRRRTARFLFGDL